jgi:hypothetical protein
MELTSAQAVRVNQAIVDWENGVMNFSNLESQLNGAGFAIVPIPIEVTRGNATLAGAFRDLPAEKRGREVIEAALLDALLKTLQVVYVSAQERNFGRATMENGSVGYLLKQLEAHQ